jgi:hypothetical protein
MRSFDLLILILIIIVIIIYLTENGLSPGGSGYNACVVQDINEHYIYHIELMNITFAGRYNLNVKPKIVNTYFYTETTITSPCYKCIVH